MAQKLFLKSIKMILLIQTPISRLVGFCHHWTCSLLNVIVSDAGSILNLVLNLCYILLSDLRFVSQLLVYVETEVLAPCRQALQYYRKVNIFTDLFVIQLLYSIQCFISNYLRLNNLYRDILGFTWLELFPNRLAIVPFTFLDSIVDEGKF